MGLVACAWCSLEYPVVLAPVSCVSCVSCGADTKMVCMVWGGAQLNSPLIPSVTHARDAGFLAQGVTVVPARVHLVVCLVESEALAELEEVRQDVEGLDIRAFNKFSRDTRRIQLSTLPHRKLSQPTRCHSVDLEALARGEGGDGKSDANLNLVFNCEGTLHGVVYWYEVDMDASAASSVSMGPADQESRCPVPPSPCHPGEMEAMDSPLGRPGMTRSLSEDHLLERQGQGEGNKTWQMVWLYARGNPFIHGHMGRGIALSVGVAADGSLHLSILPPPIPRIYVTGLGFYVPSAPARASEPALPSHASDPALPSHASPASDPTLPSHASPAPAASPPPPTPQPPGALQEHGDHQVEESLQEPDPEEEEDPFTQCKGIPLYHFSVRCARVGEGH